MRIAPLIVLALALGVSLAGCGSPDQVPSADVALVKDRAISKSTFTRWLSLAAGDKNAQQDSPGPIIVPDPPSYTKCVAAQRKQIAASRGNSRPSDADLKQGCETQYQQLKSQVMSFLIRSEWLDLQAEELGVEINPGKVKSAFDKARKQTFPNIAAYQAYLKNSGQTEADLLYRQRSQMLEEKITQIINSQSKAVTQEDIEAYYAQRRSQFTQPAVRTLNVVLTKSKSQAERAKAAIEKGESWEKVSSRYSIDPTSKSNGGILAGVSQGTQEKTFDKALFAAPKGRLEGPLKTQSGYYVFQVTSETPKKIESLDRLQDSIQQIVVSERQQQALRAFGKYYQSKWRQETICQQQYLVPDCSNYKPSNK